MKILEKSSDVYKTHALLCTQHSAEKMIQKQRKIRYNHENKQL